MKIFKSQTPTEITSRCIALEYMLKLTAPHMYKSVNEHQKKKFFYSIEVEGQEEPIQDFNWEYALFYATMHEIEKLMEPFYDDIAEIVLGEARTESANLTRQKSKQADINLMDIAAGKIKENNSIDQKLVL